MVFSSTLASYCGDQKEFDTLNSSPPSTTLIFRSLKAINLQTYKKLTTKSLPVSKTDLYSNLFRRVLLIKHRKMSGLTKIYENYQQDATA